MAAQRTGVSSLRHILRALCKLALRFPGLLLDPSVPEEIGLAVAAVIAACVASTFDDPHEGEVTGAGVIPTP
jgi:hypothetical protein